MSFIKAPDIRKVITEHDDLLSGFCCDMLKQQELDISKWRFNNLSRNMYITDKFPAVVSLLCNIQKFCIITLYDKSERVWGLTAINKRVYTSQASRADLRVHMFS